MKFRCRLIDRGSVIAETMIDHENPDIARAEAEDGIHLFHESEGPGKPIPAGCWVEVIEAGQ